MYLVDHQVIPVNAHISGTIVATHPVNKGMRTDALLNGDFTLLATPEVFRHYWVLVKLLLTIFATIVLLMKMPLIGYAARRAAETTVRSI